MYRLKFYEADEKISEFGLLTEKCNWHYVNH